MTQSRLEFLDNAKGIAIILMVYGHVELGIRYTGVIPNYVAFKYITNLIYTFHMPLFFAISGYLLSKLGNKRKFLSELKRNTSKIAVPYLIWKNVFTATKLLIPSQINFPAQPFSLLSIILPSAHYWYLFVLYFIKIMSSFLTKRANLTVILISAVSYLLLPNYYNWALNLFFFTLGRAIHDYGISLKWSSSKSHIAVCILSGFAFLVYAHLAITQFTFQFSMIAALFGVALTIQLSQLFSSTVICWIGKNTLPIYILHVFFTAAFRIVLSNYLHFNNTIVHVVCGTLIGIIGPLAIIIMAERLKIRRYLFLG